MSKSLIVATEIQKMVFVDVLLGEITSGFWKNARPADHADSWIDVSVVVGADLGPSGFDVPRNYNFVNPDFFRKAEEKLILAARKVNPEISVKQLKKQLIMLNQIIGDRVKSPSGAVTKLARGRKAPTDGAVKGIVNLKAKTTVRKVTATFADSETNDADVNVAA